MLSFRSITPLLKPRRFAALLIASFTLAAPLQAMAGEAKVLRVKATETDENLWSFSVTVRHKDKGWKHYADNWEVLSPDGDILARRVLAHPHVNEQPFTRRLSGVKIPDELTEVIVRAHDSVHGYGDKRIRIDLTTGETTKFDYEAPDESVLEEDPSIKDVKTDN